MFSIRPRIHIGFPKCASTSFQELLLSQAPEFYSICPPNLYHDTPKLITETNSLVFSHDSLVFERDVDQLRCKLEEILKPIVFSDEGLVTGRFFLKPETVALRLANVFPNARILMILRNQIDLIESYYSQRRYLGFNLPNIDRFIDAELQNPTSEFLSRFNFQQSYEVYEANFGADNITVCLLEDLRESNPIFTRSLSEFLDMNISDVQAWFQGNCSNKTGSRPILSTRFYFNLFEVLRQGDFAQLYNGALRKGRRMFWRDHLAAMNNASRLRCKDYYRKANNRLR